MRPLLVAMFILLVAFSGCSDPPAPQDRKVDTGPDVGAIRGVVVDETITPVVGAMVTLLTSGDSTTIDEQGLFVFKGLEPGSYTMEAAAAGFHAVQTTVDVRAGEVSRVELVMQAEGSPLPYHTTWQHHGFAEAYLGFASYIVDTLDVLDLGEHGCDCSMQVTPDPDAVTFVLEAFGEVWMDDPGTPYDSIYWEIINADGYDTSDPTLSGHVIHSSHDRFPVHHQVGRDIWPEEATTWDVHLTGGMWIHPQLEYDVFFTVFYHEPAPDGWSISS